eukprot:scaffold185618_cov67-Attheya_sp.AAC.1
MTRFTIPGDRISVAFGYDGLTGVFLSDGGGSYFDLHTGQHGFGIKVDDNTMATYLKRFGVPDDKVNELPLNLTGTDWAAVRPGTSNNKVGSWKVCTTCRTKSRSCHECGACKTVPYCVKECQKKDWHIHKLFCGLRIGEPHPSTEGADSIKAFLFPEGSDTPALVRLPVVRVQSDEDDITSSTYTKVDCEEFITGYTKSIRSDLFTDKSIRALPNAYHVLFKEDSDIDGYSKMNQCVLKLFQKYDRVAGSNIRNQKIKDSYWKSNIIVVKSKSGELEPDEYQDMSIADATEVVKFLYKYTSTKGLIG